MLTLDSVTAGYGDTTVLRAVDLTLGDGEVVALLGPNGAGKTTLLKTATGFVRPRSGRITVNGDDVTGDAPHRYSRRGICHLPEGRGIFPSLTVLENLTVQARGIDVRRSLPDLTGLFPVLATRLGQTAGSLSGGEQQMLALSRAYLTNPTVILVDEPSLGLAPRVVDQIYEILAQFVARGISLIVVEQYVKRALAIADRVYILSRGEVIHEGHAADLSPTQIYQRYLGL
ncbi:MAG TPA: ABC transporter ATP-binding protein [Trebonia sp.]|jgi:branched-chain amino acid transport system ATP-binding protein|nr:ABC transporter ATP-binding protein [Trebonia sp.]